MAERRAIQCPGCFAVDVRELPDSDHYLECDCGETPTVIDLREQDSPAFTQPASPSEEGTGPLMHRGDLRRYCEDEITRADAERRETSVIEPYERATGECDAFNAVLGHFDLLDDDDCEPASPSPVEEGDDAITVYRRMKAAADGARAERDIMREAVEGIGGTFSFGIAVGLALADALNPGATDAH